MNLDVYTFGLQQHKQQIHRFHASEEDVGHQSMTEGAFSQDEECWEYLDPNKVKRGPFSRSRMLVWYQHKMLPEELGVRFEDRMPFTPIKELFPPPLKPFECPTLPRPAGSWMVKRLAARGKLGDTEMTHNNSETRSNIFSKPRSLHLRHVLCCGALENGMALTADERKMLKGVWPLDLLEDPLRQPRRVTTALEFLREVLISEHLGDFIVLPDGVKLLGLSEKDLGDPGRSWEILGDLGITWDHHQ
eukprot:s321_g4.t1